MTPLLPSSLTPADLPLAELAAARLDGELFTLAGAWCPVDACDGAQTRADAIARFVPARAVAERLTAAWIFGLAPEPAQHQFCVAIGARTHKPDDAAVHLREVRLEATDTQTIGLLRVTTPLRTARDLARWGGASGRPVETALLADLLARAGCRDRPEPQRGISFSKQATTQLQDAARMLSTQLLAVADPVDVVDGVDPAHGVQHPVQVGGVPHLEDEPADRQSVA